MHATSHGTAPSRWSQTIPNGCASQSICARTLRCVAMSTPTCPAPMDIAQFPGGHSNLTYLVRFGSSELVDAAAAARTAARQSARHGREFAWLVRAAPRVSARAADRICSARTRTSSARSSTSWNGAADSSSAATNRQCWRSPAATDARQRSSRRHAWRRCTRSMSRAAALARLGKPAGFVERQVRGWTERWQRSKTDARAGDGRGRGVAGATICRPISPTRRSSTATSSSTTSCSTTPTPAGSWRCSTGR